MNIREAAELLSTTRERVVSLIEDGIALPESGRLLQLQADGSKPSYDISEESLDAFLAAREKEDTGRYPRVAVRRELLVESGHRCAIDRERGPLQFHHIIEFAQVQHHDPTGRTCSRMSGDSAVGDCSHKAAAPLIGVYARVTPCRVPS